MDKPQIKMKICDKYKNDIRYCLRTCLPHDIVTKEKDCPYDLERISAEEAIKKEKEIQKIRKRKAKRKKRYKDD